MVCGFRIPKLRRMTIVRLFVRFGFLGNPNPYVTKKPSNRTRTEHDPYNP
jgi:hypothetical protein